MPASGSARLDRVVLESALEPGEGTPTLGSHLSGKLGPTLSGEDAPVDEVDERSVDTHQGIGHDPRFDAVGAVTGLFGDERGQCSG